MAEQGCCRWCASFIFTLGLTALFMWLSLRTSSPNLSIEDFYVPVLNKTANGTQNTTLYFELKLANSNKEKGIYYDDLNMTFYYGQNRSFSVGNFTVPGFRQGNNKKTSRKEIVNTRGVPWEDAKTAVSNGTAVFRVNLETEVRYRIMVWKTKRHGIKVGGDVNVNAEGKKEGKKGVKLKSGARECNRVPVGLFVFLVFLLLW